MRSVPVYPYEKYPVRPHPHQGYIIKKFIFLVFVCLLPGILSFADKKLTYTSDVFVFASAEDIEHSPKYEQKKPIVLSPNASKKQIKGSKFVPPPQNLREIIEKVAEKHGVDPIVMSAISFCESDYNAKAKNINTSGSKDSGVAQINDFHLPELRKLGLDRDNPQDAFEFMAILIARNGLEYGTSDYRHSKECWDVAVKVARN